MARRFLCSFTNSNQMISIIVSEFEAAGWYVKPGKIINTWIVKPYPAHYKEYLLIPLKEDWVLSSNFQTHDPEHQEALSVLNRARIKSARDRLSTLTAIASENATNPMSNDRGKKMASFLKISADEFINFDNIRKLTAEIKNGELNVTVWWRDGENSDIFHHEPAKKLMTLVELYALASLRQLQPDGGED